jgi:hypothetical protein
MGDGEGESTIYEDARVVYIVAKINSTYPKLATGGPAKFDKAFQNEENA